MDDWCEVESLASSWSAVDVPQEDWSELDSVASVRSLATPHGEDPSTCDLGSRGPSPLSFDGALHVPLALFLASPPADIVEVLAAVPDAEVRRRQRRLREWAPAFDYWGGAGERGPAARAAERLCAGPVS